MPLWNIYHTDDTFNGEEKAELADRITNIVYPHLPAFYVGVVFQEVTAENFYIAGKPAKNFVRIWIDHIARTLPLPEHKADWMRRAISNSSSTAKEDLFLSRSKHVTRPELFKQLMF